MPVAPSSFSPASTSPLDTGTILDSVRKTAKAIVVYEDNRSFGAGAEIVATIAEEAMFDLDAPIVRVGAGVTGAGVGAFQAMIGVGSIAGLWLGGRAANRNAGKSWILQGFAIQAVAMTTHFAATHHALPAGLPSKLLVALAIFLAATALFSITPVIQSRLIQMTHGAPVALALNGSVISVGQALGSTLGGAALAGFGVPAIPAAALGMSLTAALILTFVFPRTPPPVLEKLG